MNRRVTTPMADESLSNLQGEGGAESALRPRIDIVNHRKPGPVCSSVLNGSAVLARSPSRTIGDFEQRTEPTVHRPPLACRRPGRDFDQHEEESEHRHWN
jgi:hypothetical protein